MAETAAHLVDPVFPEAPVRQWVLSVPFSLRYRLAYDSSLVRDVAQIFMCTVFSSIRRRTGIPSSNRKARCGAVGFTQRFSDALFYDPHIQLMSLDGVSIENSNGELALRRVGPPRDVEVSRVADRIRRRVARVSPAALPPNIFRYHSRQDVLKCAHQDFHFNRLAYEEREL